MSDWYKENTTSVATHFKTESDLGLTESEALLRLTQYGPNALVEKHQRSLARIVLAQFTSSVVITLIVSAFLSAALGDLKNALSIAVIVILNALLGFSQEHRAERALAALKRWAVPNVKIRREGQWREVSVREVVPGDVVSLEVGNMIPADGRLLTSINLRTQEAALTGESVSVEKRADALGPADRPLAERFNMVFSGTMVAAGRGLMIVTETGMTTELGRIAAMIQSVEQEPTPLQRRLDQVGHRLALAALAIVAVIFGLGLLRGEDVKLMFLTAVSIAVAAVPEGLPAIVTINLAFGAQRMLKRNALIRRLPAVETLGSVSVICTDKTGTLTQNKMTVTSVILPTPQGTEAFPLHPNPQLNVLLMGVALCNDSVFQGERVLGESTETALALASAQCGLKKSDLDKKFPREYELAFDSHRKRMSTVHLSQTVSDLGPAGTRIAFVKGAVDSLLHISTAVRLSNSELVSLTSPWQERLHNAQNELAQNGMRVMGAAYRVLKEEEEFKETDLVFVGLLGLQDPPRLEVKDAVRLCVDAGIKPVMITGDHPVTARAIAKELNFPEGAVVTGPELDRMTLAQLSATVLKTTIFARVSPEHKLNIVQAFQDHHHIVAMTGDGVNDAPALKKADIGVAMGITGTDVAKETAHMVLLDDNFSTIVAAVKEGRVIYDNIRKFLRYLMTGNVGEICLMFLAPFFGMPMPLLPLQILWINLVTDGFPALALGVEPADRNIMKRAPVPSGENIFGRGMGHQIVWLGLPVGLIPLFVGLWYWKAGNPAWQTMVFSTLIFAHVIMALAMRSQHDSFFQMPLFSNKYILLAVFSSLVLQMIVIYVPFFQSFFGTLALSKQDLGRCFVFGSLVFVLVEIDKFIRRTYGSLV